MAPVSDKIPVFRKKVASFLAKEDGKISKEKLIKAGVLAAVISLSVGMHSKPVSSEVTCDVNCTNIGDPADVTDDDVTHDPIHSNSLEVRPAGPNTFEGRHGHCVQQCHSSHASHNSHGSHCSGKWC